MSNKPLAMHKLGKFHFWISPPWRLVFGVAYNSMERDERPSWSIDFYFGPICGVYCSDKNAKFGVFE